MRIPLKQHPLIVIISLLCVALLVWGFWPQAVMVEVAEARRAELTIAIEEEGRTRVVDRYVISSPVDGVACRTQLDVGDRVESHQVLLAITPLASQVLDPRSRAQAEAQVAAAQAKLSATRELAHAAKAAAQLAETKRNRLQALVDEGAVSQDAFDKADSRQKTSAAQTRSANFDVEVARYELQAARSLLKKTTVSREHAAEQVPVRSPVAGKVLKIVHECEGAVKTGDPLLEVGDPASLEVEVDVLSADAVKLKPGLKVQFERWGGKQTLKGIVRIVEPVGFTKVSALGVEEQRVLIISDFSSPVDQWQRLGDGYRVDARFILWHQDDVLQIPTSSLFRYNDGWSCFVISNKKAELRMVKVGQRNGLRAQILAGVKVGERVIDHPSDAVDDGSRVTVRTHD